MKIRLAALSGALLLGTNALAWHDRGHMLVAQIALLNLNPAARAQAERIVGVGAQEKNNNFLTAACWADDTKNKESGPWHYINWHFNDERTPSPNQPESENVIKAIERFTKELSNTGASDETRGAALRYLIHFVGDIHQPMHNVARDSAEFPNGDRGGNDFLVGESGLKPRPKNLHYLWDSGCGLFLKKTERPLNPDLEAELKLEAKQLMAAFTPEKLAKQANEMDPTGWSKEGEALARRYCYAMQPGANVTPEYLATGQRVAGYQVTLAGYRLANLLNRILGGNQGTK